MSSEIVAQRVRQLLQEDDSLTDANECRNSIAKLKSKLRGEFPQVKIEYLVYPKAKKGDGVHYALSATDDQDELLINPVSAPGFPQFIGKISQAIPTFSLLKKTSEVK